MMMMLVLKPFFFAVFCWFPADVLVPPLFLLMTMDGDVSSHPDTIFYACVSCLRRMFSLPAQTLTLCPQLQEFRDQINEVQDTPTSPPGEKTNRK